MGARSSAGSLGLVEAQKTALDSHHDDGRREVLGGGLNAEERTVTHTMVGFAAGDTEAFCPDRWPFWRKQTAAPGISSRSMMSRIWLRSRSTRDRRSEGVTVEGAAAGCCDERAAALDAAVAVGATKVAVDAVAVARPAWTRKERLLESATS